MSLLGEVASIIFGDGNGTRGQDDGPGCRDEDVNDGTH